MSAASAGGGAGTFLAWFDGFHRRGGPAVLRVAPCLPTPVAHAAPVGERGVWVV